MTTKRAIAWAVGAASLLFANCGGLNRENPPVDAQVEADVHGDLSGEDTNAFHPDAAIRYDAAIDPSLRVCIGSEADVSTNGWTRTCDPSYEAQEKLMECKNYWFTSMKKKTCEDAVVLYWTWVTHDMECVYQQGKLVGLTMHNDTPVFCGNTANSFSAGATDVCTSTPFAPLADCPVEKYPYTHAPSVP